MSSENPFDLLVAYLQGKTDAVKLHAVLKPQCTQTKDALAIYQRTKLTQLQKQQLKNLLCVPKATLFKQEPQTLGEWLHTLNPFGSPKHETPYEPENLLDWIDHLNKAGFGNGQLADFRHELKQIHAKPDWSETLLVTTLLTGITAFFFYLNPKQLQRVEQALVRIAPFIVPTLLVFLQIKTIAEQAYRTRYEDTFYSLEHRARRWLTGTLPALMNLVAYGVIATVGAMSPLAAALFVASSFVAVFDGAVSWVQLHFSNKNHVTKTNPTWEEKLSTIRQEERETRTGQTLKVKLIAAIALSAVATIFSLFPPTSLIIIACSSLFILIPLTKNAWLDAIHTSSSKQLLERLGQCDGTPTVSPGEILEPQVQKVAEDVADLTKRVNKLEQAEAARLSQAGMFRNVSTQWDEDDANKASSLYPSSAPSI